MNVSFRQKHTLFLIAVFFSFAMANKEIGEEKFYTAPRSTATGIIFSDHLSNGLFLAAGTGVSAVSSMPGSGLYYTVSHDGGIVGFKEIQANGQQIPVLYDLVNNIRTILYSESPKIGQISFTDDGTVAFTVDKDLIVISKGMTMKYPLGTYSNIAPISPDGKMVVYNDNSDQLWVMNLATLGRTKITSQQGSFAFPQWSPDGSQILYSLLSGTLFIYSIAEKTTTMLCSGDAPSWIDNSTILFSQKIIERQQLLSSDLWSIRSNGTEKKQLTYTTDEYEIDPQYDQRTSSIIYTDVNRGGIYSRAYYGENGTATEREILSYNDSMLKKTILTKSSAPLSPVTAAAINFDMPYVHQVWDTPDWYNGSSACGATSSIMVIAYYNLVPRWNVWCSASGSSPGHMSPYGNYVCDIYAYREITYSYTANDPNGKPSYGGYGFMWTGSYSPYSRTVDYYGNHGMSATRYDSNATFFQTVIANVDSGYPFTMCNGLTTAGHIIVVNGYDVNNRTLIVNDPYGNKNTGTYPSLNGKGVKYDWVGYNNGYKNLNRIYWGVSVRYNAVAQADSVVDDANLDKGFYLHTSAPSSLKQWYDKKSGGYLNGHFWWTRTKISDTCYATWTPNLAKSGLYEVSAFIPYSDATKAKYYITASDTLHEVVIDQKKVKNDWVSLGIFPFLEGKNGFVRLGDGSDTTKQGIIFDALQWKYRGSLTTSVAAGRESPEIFSLDQNYPNPFNPSTVIGYHLPKRALVSLKLYDVLGREAADLMSEEQNAGYHHYQLSSSQFLLSSGIYFYTMKTGTYSETKRLIILK